MSVSTSQERDFEKKNVLKKRDSYLKRNPVARLSTDKIFASKTQFFIDALTEPTGSIPEGWVLDLGGNTGGEALVFQDKGVHIAVCDINEIALIVAQERARKFELPVPPVITADVHHLPLETDSFEAVTIVEALHHFEDYHVSLKEILRILTPGGQLVALEPNGWNPFRRISEIRDRFRGTIEKSFTTRQLTQLLTAAGFVNIKISHATSGRPKDKMHEVPFWRRPAAILHAWLQQNYPRFFGAYLIQAHKKGEITKEAKKPFNSLLRSPGGHSTLTLMNDHYCDSEYCYPVIKTVPVLLKEDRVPARSIQL
ncbi:MAG: class I SAM-dependent methyltransferase [Akkermansiaceae bacterium]